MDEMTVKTKVDEFAKWSKLLDDCKREIEILKGEFELLGSNALRDKKIKQVEFWGNNNTKVVVTESETLKVIFPTFLSGTLGNVLKDYSKEEITYKYSEPFKRLLIAIFQGSYIDRTLDDVIRQISVDDEVKKVLKKKIKGKWQKDVDVLVSVGIGREEAEFFAYQAQEAIAWERILGLLKAAGHEPGTLTFDEALEAIKAAVIVEEGIKVGVEMDDNSGEGKTEVKLAIRQPDEVA